METNRVNIVVGLDDVDSSDVGFESRVIGTLLDALEVEGLEPADIAVVALT